MRRVLAFGTIIVIALLMFSAPVSAGESEYEIPDGFNVSELETGTGEGIHAFEEDEIDLEDVAYIGSPDAPIKMIGYEDFLGPFGQRFTMEGVFSDIKRSYIYGGQVQYFQKHFPVVGGEEVAAGAECAKQQDPEQFWHFQFIVYDNQEELEELDDTEIPSTLQDIAERLDLDATAFASCLEDEVGHDIVEDHSQEARSLNLSGVPTNIIGEENITGAKDFSEFDQELFSQLDVQEIQSCASIDESGVYKLTDDLSSSETCIEITADEVILHGNDHTVKGSDSSNRGVHVQGDNVVIRDIRVEGHNDAGILYENSESGAVFSSRVTNNEHGIELSDTSNLVIARNKAEENDASGVRLSSTNRATISDNILEHNYRGLHLRGSDNNHILSNELNHNERQGSLLWESSRNKLAGNFLQNNTAPALFLWHESENNVVEDNFVKDNNGQGILIQESSEAYLSENHVSNNDGHGLRVLRSSNNTVTRNHVEYNDGSGITVSSSYNNTLADNTAENNQDTGISLSSTNNTVVSENDVSGSENEGIFIGYDSTGSTLDQNSVTDNDIGIQLRQATPHQIKDNIVSSNKEWDFSTEDGSVDQVNRLILENSTAPATVLSFEAKNVALRANTSPPNSSNLYGLQSIERYFDAEKQDDTGYLDLAFHYNEEDVRNINESSLTLWKNNGEEWRTIENSYANTTENTVNANLSDFSTFGVFGNEVLPEDVLEKDIRKGWNYVSLPIATSSTPEIEEVMDTEQIESVWRYTEEGWENYHPDAPTNDFETIRSGEGYLLQSTDTFTVRKNMSALTETDSVEESSPAYVDLHHGYNLVGHYWTEPVEALTALSTVGEDYLERIYGQSAGGQLAITSMDRTDKFVPGEAYWVFSKDERVYAKSHSLTPEYIEELTEDLEDYFETVTGDGTEVKVKEISNAEIADLYRADLLVTAEFDGEEETMEESVYISRDGEYILAAEPEVMEISEQTQSPTYPDETDINVSMDHNEVLDREISANITLNNTEDETVTTQLRVAPHHRESGTIGWDHPQSVEVPPNETVTVSSPYPYPLDDDLPSGYYTLDVTVERTDIFKGSEVEHPFYVADTPEDRIENYLHAFTGGQSEINVTDITESEMGDLQRVNLTIIAEGPDGEEIKEDSSVYVTEDMEYIFTAEPEDLQNPTEPGPTQEECDSASASTHNYAYDEEENTVDIVVSNTGTMDIEELLVSVIADGETIGDTLIENVVSGAIESTTVEEVSEEPDNIVLTILDCEDNVSEW